LISAIATIFVDYLVPVYYLTYKASELCFIGSAPTHCHVSDKSWRTIWKNTSKEIWCKCTNL